MELLIGLFLGMIILGRVLFDRADTNQALRESEDRIAQVRKWKADHSNRELEDELFEQMKHKENYPQIVSEIHAALKGVPYWEGWTPALFESQYPAAYKGDVQDTIIGERNRALDVLMGVRGYIATTNGFSPLGYRDDPGIYELITWIQRKMFEAGRPAKIAVSEFAGTKWYKWVRGEYEYKSVIGETIAFIPPRIPGKAVPFTPPQTNTRGDQA